MSGIPLKIFGLAVMVIFWFGGANAAEIPVIPMVPSASQVPGTYNTGQNIVLTANGAASIRYTTDGKTPNCVSGSIYSGPIAVTQSQTIRALSCYGSGVASPIAELAYKIKPSAAVGAPRVAGASIEYPRLAEMEIMIAELKRNIQAIIETMAQHNIAPYAAISAPSPAMSGGK